MTEYPFCCCCRGSWQGVGLKLGNLASGYWVALVVDSWKGFLGNGMLRDTAVSRDTALLEGTVVLRGIVASRGSASVRGTALFKGTGTLKGTAALRGKYAALGFAG